MGIVQNSIINVKGKKTQSLIIFIIILLILLFEITGLLIRSASQEAEEDTYRQIGLCVNIVSNCETQNGNDTIITNDMIRNLIAKNHIVGYDSYLESFCNPVNFFNIKKYSGENPATQNDQADDSLQEIKVYKDQISLVGGLNIKYNERFYKSQNILIKGAYPDQDHKGAIISEQLADTNNLTIGDIILIEDNDTQNKMNLEIIGIYKTNLEFKILKTNFMGEGVFRSSPYNIVYTNYDSVNSIKNNVCPLIFLTVWVDSPQYIQTVMVEIIDDETWKNYSVYDITGIVYTQYAQKLTTIGNISKYVIFLSLMFGGIILIIAMTFFANSYMYETGLYIILGIKRFRILLIQFLQMFMIVFAALLISISLSPLISIILNNLLEVNYVSIMSDSTIYSYYTGDMDIKQNFHISVMPEIFIGMAGILVIIVVVSSIIPFLATMRVKPNEILAGNKKG